MSIEASLDVDALDIIELLSRHHARFMLVGAHALAAHGITRATADTDLWVEPSRDNAAHVIAALREFGAPLSAHGVTEADFATAGATYQLGLPPRRVDFLTELSGLEFTAAWNERIVVKIRGHDIAVLGRNSLLKNKRASGRSKDRVDVELLERDPPK